MQWKLPKRCEMNVYVVEALLANPHKYGNEDKERMIAHVADCDVCQETIEYQMDFENRMERM